MSESSSFIYAVIAGIVPSFIWLIFWLREDEHQPEPRWLMAATFLGGVLAVVPAVFAEKYIADIISDQSLRYTLWAAVEEILKLGAIAIIALNSDYNDEPIDAMIYCIVVALGFAALENTLFIMRPLHDGEIVQSIITGNLRFVGATLVHTVSSAFIGFGLGMAFYRGYIVKFLAVIIGLSAAITLHSAFNLSIINSDPSDTLKTFVWIWIAVVILIVLFEEVKAVKPKFRRIEYNIKKI